MNTVMSLKKNKKSFGGAAFYAFNTPGTTGYVTFADIRKALREGEIHFHGDNEGLDRTLLSVIHSQEIDYKPNQSLNITKKGDTKLLNRIIQNGGLVEYALKLEGML
jgi:hypothetical protein